MKIENVRLGLATNSSSSHSIIFNLDVQSRDWEEGEFGWNEFCCNCEKSKRLYLAATLFQNLAHLGPEIAKAVVQAWLEETLPGKKEYELWGIDHQSLMSLPVNTKTQQVDETFFRDLTAYYMQPELAIVGGNDNEEPQIFTNGRHNHILPTDDHRKAHTCRKDPQTGHWVLFNTYNGTKIRLHFNSNAPTYTKSYTPELIDIKITDCCEQNCRYCYQNSTKDGKHADMNFIRHLAWVCQDMQVFEVALGGGEPTLHPDFPEILKTFRCNGIVPNFSTRSYKWLHDQKIREAVREFAGKFAFSVTYAHEMQRAWHLADEFGLARSDYDYKQYRYGCRMGFQYVMGTTSLEDFAHILEEIPSSNIPITLLGYKQTGRGSTWKQHKYGNWLNIIQNKARRWVPIGIDTALAQEHKSQVLALVDQCLVTFEEGKFSMYVDAVTKQAAPRSYCAPKEYIDIGSSFPTTNGWIELFQRF